VNAHDGDRVAGLDIEEPRGRAIQGRGYRKVVSKNPGDAELFVRTAPGNLHREGPPLPARGGGGGGGAPGRQRRAQVPPRVLATIKGRMRRITPGPLSGRKRETMKAFIKTGGGNYHNSRVPCSGRLLKFGRARLPAELFSPARQEASRPPGIKPLPSCRHGALAEHSKLPWVP